MITVIEKMKKESLKRLRENRPSRKDFYVLG
jgi:hypothetical protein